MGVCVARRGRQCTQESLHPLLFERCREGKSTVGHKGARGSCVQWGRGQRWARTDPLVDKHHVLLLLSKLNVVGRVLQYLADQN